ncbi:MFS transporter [Glutamicibacter ardleyensis]|uniref:MFS transporter n=1 Tax=Glutamicibacter ardleyensis TaxID=225894 RepID=UPI003FD3DD06
MIRRWQKPSKYLDAKPIGLLGRRNFRILLTSTGLETIGDDVVKSLIPLGAVSVLGANAFEVGIINALGMVAFLVIGVPAGTWVDQLPKRKVMITADLIRCLTVMLVVVTFAADVLNLWHLMGAIVVLSFADVFYSTASSTILPKLVKSHQLSDATAKILSVDTVLGMLGPMLASLLTKLFGIFFALIAAPVSYVLSALASYKLPSEVDTRISISNGPDSHKASLAGATSSGLRFTVANPYIRPLFLSNMLVNSAAIFGGSAQVVFALTILHVSPGMLAMVGSVAALGALVGSMVAETILRNVGIGRTRILASLASAPFVLVVPFSEALGIAPFAALAISGFGWSLCTALNVVAGAGIIPRLTPPDMLGRVSANVRVFTLGVMPLASIAGGSVANAFGLEQALYGWAALGCAAAIPVLFSPIRKWKVFPEALDVNLGTVVDAEFKAQSN